MTIYRKKNNVLNNITQQKTKKNVRGLEVKYLAWPGTVKVSLNKNYLKMQNNESVFILSEF